MLIIIDWSFIDRKRGAFCCIALVSRSAFDCIGHAQTSQVPQLGVRFRPFRHPLENFFAYLYCHWIC